MYLRDGDHIQIFGGKFDPDTGEARKIMTIWSGSTLKWWGPVDEQLIADNRAIVRDIDVRIPLELHHAFKIERSPLTRK